MLSSIFGWLLFVVIIGIIIDILAKTFDIIVAIFLVVFVGGIVGSYFKLFQDGLWYVNYQFIGYGVINCWVLLWN